MATNSVLPMKAALAPVRETSWRRTSHGGSAFASEPSRIQPQDGVSQASEVKGRVSAINSRLRVGAEPEDARLTGLTRSLFRRLTGLNVMIAPTPSVPATAARKAPRVMPLAEQAAKVA
jgi:hypothetical protein